MLRRVLTVVAAIGVLGSVVLLLLGQGPGIVLGFWAVVLLAALLFERGRYRPKTGAGPWTRTAERFQDPATGKWTVVEFNPATGERRYVEE